MGGVRWGERGGCEGRERGIKGDVEHLGRSSEARSTFEQGRVA